LIILYFQMFAGIRKAVNFIRMTSGFINAAARNFKVEDGILTIDGEIDYVLSFELEKTEALIPVRGWEKK